MQPSTLELLAGPLQGPCRSVADPSRVPAVLDLIWGSTVSFNIYIPLDHNQQCVAVVLRV